MSWEELRAEAVARVEALVAAHAEVMAASEGSNADDEHDPEGATIGFERQQLLALLTQARASLQGIDQALEAVTAGTYGVCAACGSAIGQERLAARPSATLCIGCAKRQSGGR